MVRKGMVAGLAEDSCSPHSSKKWGQNEPERRGLGLAMVPSCPCTPQDASLSLAPTLASPTPVALL